MNINSAEPDEMSFDRSEPNIERANELPLSSAQRSIWLAQMLDRKDPAFNVGECVEILGAVDRRSFEQALRLVVETADALHLEFFETDDGPRQRFNFHPDWELPYLDFSAAATPGAAAAEWMDEQRRRPFQLNHGPLYRFALLKLSSDRYFWYAINHHLVNDGIGAGLILTRVAAAYTELTRAIPVDERHHGSWRELLADELAYRSSDSYRRDREFWNEELTNLGQRVTLSGKPTARPAGFISSVGWLPPWLHLDKIGRRYDATAAAVVIAATAIYLHRITGETDILLAMPVGARVGREMRSIVGMAANTVLIRMSVASNDAIGDVVKRAAKKMRAAMRHQRYRYEDVRRELGFGPNEGEVAGTFVNFTPFDDDIKFGDKGILRSPLSNWRVEDLQIVFYGGNHKSGARIDFIANSVHYRQEDLEQHRDRFINVLSEIALIAAHAPVASVQVSSPAERELVLRDWNATDAAFPSDRCIHELIEAQAAKTPEAVAVIFEAERISYADLNARANRLAHWLIAEGIKPDERVAIALERSIEMVVALLATLKAGGAYVPLDPAYPVERLQFMLKDSAPRVLLTQEPVLRKLGEIRAGLSVLALDGTEKAWRACSSLNPDPRTLGLTSSNLAYVIYTSGSTGTPKGVMIEHRSLQASTTARLQAYGVYERLLFFSSLSFDSSVASIFGTLASGGALVLMPPKAAKDPKSINEQIANARITSILAVPSLLNALADVCGSDANFSLRQISTGGEACTPDLIKKIGTWAPQAALYNEYGPTEATVWATMYRCPADQSRNLVPIGKPIANTRIYILDGTGEPVPVGSTGEIYIGGAGVARGYLNRHELTSERFLRDPFAAEQGQADARMYRTGDRGRWRPDGNIEFLGRNDDQVKIRGVRIELGEIEAALRAVPGIRDAAVIAREDRPGEKRLVAYYVAAEDVAVTRLREHLTSSLPEYLVPSAYVRMLSLPLMLNDKLDRQALPEPVEAIAFGVRSYEAPQGPVEMALAEIWSELLHVERIGRHYNFFELGGHSLLAIALMERLRRRGWHVDVHSLFTHSTLAGLAASIIPALMAVDVPSNRIVAGEPITPDRLALVSLAQNEIDTIVASVPGGTANVQDIYPLAPLQEGIFFHHLMATDGDPYWTPIVMAFDTRQLLDGFLNALEAVIERHDVLRTAFLLDGLSIPVQVVWRKASLPIAEVAAGGDDIVQQILKYFASRNVPTDVRKAPLMRACIAWDEGKRRWLLLLLVHHLFGDHTTLERIIEEVCAHLDGKAANLPAPVPFRNFVAQALQSSSRENHEAFFRDMLGDIDEPTAPYGLYNVRGDGSDIVEFKLELDRALSARIRAEARRAGVSAASIFHVAWALVVSQASGGKDAAVFGTVLFGRMQGAPGVDRGVGLFLNTLPIRIAVDDKPVRETLRNTHSDLAELLRHEHASLVLAQRCSAVQSPTPLFTSLLNYRYGTAMRGQPWPGIQVLHAEERTNYPFFLTVDDLRDNFKLEAQVVAPLDASRICAFVETALNHLISALELGGETPTSSLRVLPDAERQLVLHGWNATDAAYPVDRCIHELIEDQAAKMPEAVAVRFEDEKVSYAELNARANRLAHWLIAEGVKPDERVAIGLERSVEMVVALLATLKAGGAYVPLDPAYPVERLQFMLKDSAPRVLLTHETVLTRLGEMPAGLSVLALDGAETAWRECSSLNPDPRALGLTSSNLAYVIYTSGSTGQPKGVDGLHRGLVNRLAWMTATFPFGGPALIKTSIAFIDGITELLGPLICGTTAVLADAKAGRSPAAIVELVNRYAIGRLTVVPSLLATILEEGDPARLATCKLWVSSGAALPRPLVRRFHELFPDACLLNLYGTSEVSGDSLYSVCTPEDVSIGRPIWNTRAYVLDRELQPVPVGVPGILYLAGDGVAAGYNGRPDLTAEVFLPDPHGPPGSRMYRTGDLARWQPNGTLEFLGRSDDQVKLNGIRIEVGEIEAVLRTLPRVRDAAVVAFEEGPDSKRLVAFIVWDPSGRPAENSAIRAGLANQLPDAFIPSSFVTLSDLPRLPNGKLDRRALAASEVVLTDSTPGGAPLRTPTESVLAEIWSENLRRPVTSRDADYFELGGDSLRATILMTRVRKVFALELPLSWVFEAPTLEALASRIDAVQNESRGLSPMPAIERIADDRSAPLSFSQHRMWLIQSLDPRNTAYNMSVALKLTGSLDIAALSWAVDEVRRRHEILRTTYDVVGEEIVQRVHQWKSEPLDTIDLTKETDTPAVEAVRRANVRASARIDLARGPVFSCVVMRVGPDEHILQITLHHIAGDQWSFGVLGRELATLYKAARDRRPVDLRAQEVRYRDFSAWQQNWLESPEMASHMQYWRSALDGVSLLDLPTDRPRPKLQSFKGTYCQRDIPPALLGKLEQLGRRESTTLFMTMFAGFASLLHRLSGQVDIPVAVPIANRTHSAIENVIGTFVNTLVLRVDLSGDPTFSDLLSRVRAVALDAFAHQDMPFDKLVQEIPQARDPGRAPLAQVLFNMLNAPMHSILLDGIKWEPFLIDRGGAQFELSLSVDSQITKTVAIEYNTELFERATIERFIERYLCLLESAVADPEKRFSELEILSPNERRLVLQTWNATSVPPPPRPFIAMFEERAAHWSDAPAVTFEGTTLSYGMLNSRANALAHELRASGAGRGSTVGICLERSLEVLVALLAVQKSGAAYVPLDPKLPQQRLGYMISDSGLGLIISTGETARTLDLPSQLKVIDIRASGAADGSAILSLSGSSPSASDPAYIIYTSGSTGTPKGVVVSHGSLSNFLCSMQKEPGLTDSDVLAAVTTISFDIAGLELYLPLLVGARIELVSSATASDGNALSQLLLSSDATVMQATPATWRMLLDAGWQGRTNFRAFCGGEALSRELADSLIERGRELWNLYGPTETTIWSTACLVAPGNSPISIGKPIDNTRVYILNGDTPAAIGIAGEICIGGDGVAAGYHARPELTAERFQVDPFVDAIGARIYRTGDLGRWGADGQLYHMGRIDHQVKVRGFRIEPGEIEAAIHAHPAVREATVVAHEAGPSDTRLVAYVVYGGAAEPTVSDMRRYLRQSLPEYMVPSLIVSLDRLPLTPNGKIDRRQLPDPFVSASEMSGLGDEPTPGMETILADLWRDILKLDRVGADDNFFDLGGYSLLALRVVALIEKQTGARLDPRVLFFQNLRQIAAGLADVKVYG